MFIIWYIYLKHLQSVRNYLYRQQLWTLPDTSRCIACLLLHKTDKNQYASHHGTVSCLDGGTEKRLLMKCVTESEPDHPAASVSSQLAPVWVGTGVWILMSSFTLSAQEERTNKETRRWKKIKKTKHNTTLKNHKFTCRRLHRRTRIQAVSDDTSDHLDSKKCLPRGPWECGLTR